jgi:hypothetical protein
VSLPLLRLLVFCLTFAGCVAVGLPATGDPAKKLHAATALFDHRNRPVLAETLIRQALERYQTNGDELGVAEAYRTYGFFFRSASVGRLSNFYRKNGFLDKSATFDARYGKSVEYFERARLIYAAHQRFDALVNVDLNMGFTLELMGDQPAACRAFDRSLQDSAEHARQSPDAKIVLPSGFGTYEEFVASHKQRLDCP